MRKNPLYSLLLASVLATTGCADVTDRNAHAPAMQTHSASPALKILLTNDDGLTENIQAMQAALRAAGHEVVVAIPCQNQSGKGAAANFLTPVGDLTRDCRGGAAKAGAPGVGPIAALDQAFYVDATPIMATLYGLDIAAFKTWHSTPDLVISGPNEGRNLGAMVISSGTVSNAQIAMSRRIPTLAVSADLNTTDSATLAKEVASLTVKLLNSLQRNSAHPGQLPHDLALNVNFPKFSAGTSQTLTWRAARFGNFEFARARFVEDLGADPAAAAFGLRDIHQPGISFTLNSKDNVGPEINADSEGLLSAQGYVTVTPMQNGYEVAPAQHSEFNNSIRRVLDNL